MGSSNEFGPDTESIRAWLDKRATYARESRVVDNPTEFPPARDSLQAGRSVVEALRADPAAGPTPVEPVRPAPPPRARTAPEIRHGRWTEPADNLNALEASTDAQFPVRRGVRRTLSWILLAILAGTGLASYAAWHEPSDTNVGIAATLGLLLLVVWAVRAGCATTQLAIRRGQLCITRHGQTEVVDLASRYTPVAIVGEPGDRRWTVLIEREGLPLVVITRSMVDPYWFTTVLYRIRPSLRPEPPRPGPWLRP